MPLIKDRTIELHRYYTDCGLTVLCDDCEEARRQDSEFVQWAETPVEWERVQLTCYDCDAPHGEVIEGSTVEEVMSHNKHESMYVSFLVPGGRLTEEMQTAAWDVKHLLLTKRQLVLFIQFASKALLFDGLLDRFRFVLTIVGKAENRDFRSELNECIVVKQGELYSQ